MTTMTQHLPQPIPSEPIYSSYMHLALLQKDTALPQANIAATLDLITMTQFATNFTTSMTESHIWATKGTSATMVLHLLRAYPLDRMYPRV